MCLLITQSATAPSMPDHWLTDWYDYNPDGAGVMYAEKGELVIAKIVPKSAQEWIDLYREHAEGRDCAVHLRYRTHGKINPTNTHPYPIFDEYHKDGPLWLMHNGVLSIDTKSDATKSDTWHFIERILKPILDRDRELLYTEAFQEMLGEYIGNNRFVLMDHTGRTVTINSDQGLTWGGRWLSNTYAWTAPSRLTNHWYGIYTGFTGKKKPLTSGLNGAEISALKNSDIEAVTDLLDAEELDRMEKEAELQQAEADVLAYPEMTYTTKRGDPLSAGKKTTSWNKSTVYAPGWDNYTDVEDDIGYEAGYADSWGYTEEMFDEAETMHCYMKEAGMTHLHGALGENEIVEAIFHLGADFLWHVIDEVDSAARTSEDAEKIFIDPESFIDEAREYMGEAIEEDDEDIGVGFSGAEGQYDYELDRYEDGEDDKKTA